MIGRVLAVAEMTVRRLMRSRLLWIGVFGSLAVIGMFMTAVVGMVRMVASGQHVPGSMVLQVVGTVITILAWVAHWIAMFVGVNVVKRDLVEGTVASVLSKPVSRGEYIAASYAGAAIYLLMMWLVFALVLTLFAALFRSTLGGTTYLALFGEYLVCVMTMGIALFLSVLVHPWVAVMLTFMALNARAAIGGVARLIEALGGSVPDALVEVLKFPFPIQGALDDLSRRLTQGSLMEQSLGPGFAHVIDYGLVMAVLAYLVFRNLEVNRVRE